MQLNRAGLAGVLISLAVVPVATADVTVRAEGPDATLVNATVPLTGPSVTKAGATCAGDSAAGAFDRAVSDWDATNYGGSDPLFISRIFTQSLAFDGVNNRYWAFDHNNVFSSQGICAYTPQNGDELLFYAACGDTAATGCFDGAPLDIAAPATATVGAPFTVTVTQFDDTGVGSPAGGATVSGGGQTVTTDPVSGTALLTLSAPGAVVLTATKGTQVRDEATVTAMEYTIATPTPTPTATPDTDAPVSTIRGIREGQVFKHSKGPRTLRARVEEPNGIAGVAFAITRGVDGRCTAFNATIGKFVRIRCGRHPRFGVGTSARASLLLPKRLKRGRYVFDVAATDRAGNRETLARGRNRVVFRVR
ncbi:MAG: hypothetical protein QOI80_1067 [Solirubrobacteraceae bacterium]|nr:hypothetical protein [Solirubrobacteraceae bacterium]